MRGDAKETSWLSGPRPIVVACAMLFAVGFTLCLAGRKHESVPAKPAPAQSRLLECKTVARKVIYYDTGAWCWGPFPVPTHMLVAEDGTSAIVDVRTYVAKEPGNTHTGEWK